jgi:hypothetical protein
MKPLVDPIGGSITALMQMFTGKSLPAEIDTSMQDLIVKELVSRVAPRVGETLPEGVPMAVMAAELPKLIADNIKDIVVNQSPMQITEAISTPLEEYLARKAPLKNNAEATAKVIMTVGKSVAHILGLGLAQSLTGSLLYTLTHNPLQDYYCYFCSKKQLYCIYCSSHREKMSHNAYYSHYYSGFYAPYYNHYYQKYFIDLELAVDKHKTETELQVLATETVGHGLWDTTPRLIIQLTDANTANPEEPNTNQEYTAPAPADGANAANATPEQAAAAETPTLDANPAASPTSNARQAPDATTEYKSPIMTGEGQTPGT